MLKKLTINNVALISDLSMEMDAGLTILTGETGAGKSIIVDSLMLLLGGRYDKTLLKYGESAGFVEGFFTDVDGRLFESIGLEADEDAIIRRRFNQEGKNDIRINGQSVTLSMLKRFTQQLVDIYGQNEHQSLSNPAKHIGILDYYILEELKEPQSKLGELVSEYNGINKRILSIGDEQQRKRTIDILKYQIEEIHKANIQENEEEEIVSRRRMLLSSERIKSALSETSVLLSGSDNASGAHDLLTSALKAMSQISALSPSYEELYERVAVLTTELADLSECVDAGLEDMDYEAGELDALEQRLDTIRSLKRKYGDYAAMQSFLRSATEEHDFLQNAESMYDLLVKDRAALLRKIYDISNTISKLRRAEAKKLEEKVIAELSELGMRESRFEVVFNQFPSFSEAEEHISTGGMDKVEFYLSANPGQPLLPLAKIISGGEMSRFMLALKVITSTTDTVQTMVFDEIDAGISGSIGRVIACKLARISSHRQVISVTHLPQIAAMADTHYFISKSISGEENRETTTTVTLLNEEGMISEVSRLSGGQDISKAAIDTAKEIKEWSNKFKSSFR